MHDLQKGGKFVLIFKKMCIIGNERFQFLWFHFHPSRYFGKSTSGVDL